MLFHLTFPNMPFIEYPTNQSGYTGGAQTGASSGYASGGYQAYNSGKHISF